MTYITNPAGPPNAAGHAVFPTLHLARVPGDLGPVLHCSGELTVATAEALRRQLDLLIPLRHPALILNVAACRAIDTDGMLLLLDACGRVREQGRRFAVVAGTDSVARILRMLGIDGVLPVFPTEAAATFALGGGPTDDGPSDDAPASWAEAREESLAMWRAILTALDDGPVDDVVARITATHGLCRRAEESLDGWGTRGGTRCYLCPLFHVLGARLEDVGCASLTQPMVDALLGGNRGAARAQVARLIQLIERMPLPPD
jgi:anti-anti-sigma factor